MVDCALSQFSYGKLESTRLAGRQLPVPGGCDEDGQLTTDPAAIEKSGRALPIGYWKGSGLSILLDLIATLLSGGNAVHTIGTFGDEIGLTQIMIAIDPTKFGTVEENDAVISAILADIKASTPARPDGEVRWPGEGMLRTIKENRELGVPVVEEIWGVSFEDVRKPPCFSHLLLLRWKVLSVRLQIHKEKPETSRYIKKFQALLCLNWKFTAQSASSWGYFPEPAYNAS